MWKVVPKGVHLSGCCDERPERHTTKDTERAAGYVAHTIDRVLQQQNDIPAERKQRSYRRTGMEYLNDGQGADLQFSGKKRTLLPAGMKLPQDRKKVPHLDTQANACALINLSAT